MKSKNSNDIIVKKNAGENIKIAHTDLKKSAEILRALNHPMRKDMIQMMDEKGSITVTEIYEKLKIEQSVCSQQLAILRKSGIVKTSKDGKKVHYSVNKEKLAEISDIIIQLAC